MKEKEAINKMYEAIADELNISDSVFESINKSYKALGEYIENNLAGKKVAIFPQGSLNLGTLIKPISDEDEYDLDAVCKIYDSFDNPKELKQLIGKILKNSNRYSKMLQPEGKRCWTLKYSDESHFHMDILPSCPNNEIDHSLKITHKENGKYEYRISNPEGYADWFDKLQEIERKRIYKTRSVNYSNNVEDLRKYNVRTTLQKTIQILKRHRDMKYYDASDEKKENKPISIIITTLVARMYNGSENIVELIEKFTKDWKNYIDIDSEGNCVIKNPVNEAENFADKWVIYPERKQAFFDWVDELKKDLITNNYLLIDGLVEQSNYLKGIFGTSTINKVFENQGKTKTKLYVKPGIVATLTEEKTDIEVKKHNFYGK